MIFVVSPHALLSRWVQHAFSIAEAARCVIVPVVIQATTLPENVGARQPIQATGAPPSAVGNYVLTLFGRSPARQPATSLPAYARPGAGGQQATTSYPDPSSPKAARGKRAVSWQAMLGMVASLATIIGVVVTILATNPGGIFSPVAPPTPLPITYHAAKPGVGCDGGAGTWVNQIGSADTHLYGAVQCEPNGLKLTNVGAYSNQSPQVLFQWPNHQFSNPYSIAVDLSSQTSHGCGGIVTNVQSLDHFGEYVYLVCPDGSTSIMVASTTGGAFTNLKTGVVSAQKAYHLLVKVAGSSLTFTVNDAASLSVKDTTFPTTSYIGLIVSGYPSDTDESAVFANFTYTGSQ